MIICIALYTYMYKMFSIDIDIFKFFSGLISPISLALSILKSGMGAVDIQQN